LPCRYRTIGAVQELLLLLLGKSTLIRRNALLDDEELEDGCSGGGVAGIRGGVRCSPFLHPQGAGPQQQLLGGYGGKGGYGGYGGKGGNGG
jgi:hypothetical protein